MAPENPQAAVPKQRKWPQRILRSRLLLVEGATPWHFFTALTQHMGIAPKIEVCDFGGVGELRNALGSLAGTPGFEQVTACGVVRDSEDEPVERARASAAHALRDLLPSHVARRPVYILPDDKNPGILETLCVAAVADDPAFPCVRAFFDCLRDAEVKVPGSVGLAKHQAQAFLASRPRVQLFPGLAAYDGHWPWGNPVFDDLKKFLLQLAADEPAAIPS